MESKGKINIYKCASGHNNITINADEGVTPMIISCREKNCGKNATSMFYNVRQDLKPRFEWYRPPASKKLNRYEAEHVNQGGLLLREIPKKDLKI